MSFKCVGVVLWCFQVVFFYIIRDRRPGTLDVHPTANALILNYELEVSVLGEKENVLYGEKAVSCWFNKSKSKYSFGFRLRRLKKLLNCRV